MGWTTPPGPRGLLCDPPAVDWHDLAGANRRTLAAWRFDVEGVPVQQLRADARRRVLALAGAAPELADGPLFVTGHQPELYHPGVWVKAFAVAQAAAGDGSFGLNVVVDHDAGELAVPIPRREPAPASDLRSVMRRLVPAGAGRPFETLPAPTLAEAEQFVDVVTDDLATTGLSREMELWQTFADGMLKLVRGGVASAAELGVRSRAAYEKAFGVETVPDVVFSAFAGSREFLLFFVHWVVHAEPLAAAYNGALAKVRQARRLRSEANPFPDLLIHPDRGVELPFWGVTPEGIRRKLYVKKKGDDLVLHHLEGQFAVIPAAGGEGAVAALEAASARVRPRAVPLTLFLRLFVADVFVHGTGGARYDEVTDEVMRQWFGVEPPAYAVVSATMHLPFDELPVQPSALRAVERQLRDLTFNPQRHAWEAFGRDEELDQRLGALVREKEQLIEEIAALPRKGKPAAAEGGAPPGTTAKTPSETDFGSAAAPSRKRVLTRAIEKTNAELYSLLGDVERSTRKRLAQLQRRARSGQAATARTYPFFLFHPNDVWKLLRNGGS